MCNLYVSIIWICDQAGISQPLLVLYDFGANDVLYLSLLYIGMLSTAVMLWRVPKRRSPFGSLMALLTGAAPAIPGSTRTRLDEEDYSH